MRRNVLHVSVQNFNKVGQLFFPVKDFLGIENLHDVLEVSQQ